MGKPDVFSQAYENLDQELKNACLKYEAAQSRKGLRVTRVSIVYTPKEAPYFDIDVEEEVKIKGQRIKVTSDPPKSKTVCKHASLICNGLGQLECVMCDLTVGPCKDQTCARCDDKADTPIPPTLRSSRLPVIEEPEDGLKEIG